MYVNGEANSLGGKLLNSANKKCQMVHVQPSQEPTLQTTALPYTHVHRIYLHDALGRLVLDVVHHVRHGVPDEGRGGVEDPYGLLGGQGWIQPGLHGLVTIQNGRHSVVNVRKVSVCLHSDDSVGVQGFRLKEMKCKPQTLRSSLFSADSANYIRWTGKSLVCLELSHFHTKSYKDTNYRPTLCSLAHFLS